MEQRRRINAYLNDHRQQLRLKASGMQTDTDNTPEDPQDKKDSSEQTPE